MLHVAFICTGNRCRSATAAALFNRIAEGLPARASSAGTLDVGPVPAPPDMVAAASRAGIDLETHRARHISGVALESADLVLGFELAHIAAAVVEAGARREVSFGLAEAVRLLEAIDPPATADPEARAREAIRRANEARAFDPAFRPGEDVRDPFGRDPAAYAAMVETVSDAVPRLVQGLFGAPTPGPAPD